MKGLRGNAAMLALLLPLSGCVTPARAQAPGPITEATPAPLIGPQQDRRVCVAWPRFIDTQGRIMESNPCVQECRRGQTAYVILANVAVPCWVVLLSLHREA
ncbi:MAG: hypothetical protein V3S55_15965 [Nitrospiraceae bacterium]